MIFCVEKLYCYTPKIRSFCLDSVFLKKVFEAFSLIQDFYFEKCVKIHCIASSNRYSYIKHWVSSHKNLPYHIRVNMTGGEEDKERRRRGRERKGRAEGRKHWESVRRVLQGTGWQGVSHGGLWRQRLSVIVWAVCYRCSSVESCVWGLVLCSIASTQELQKEGA